MGRTVEFHEVLEKAMDGEQRTRQWQIKAKRALKLSDNC